MIGAPDRGEQSDEPDSPVPETAPAGPGIEFLEYLAPRDGRPAPSDLRANDLAHWQTRLVTSSAEAAGRALRRARAALVSPGVVRLPSSDLGFVSGLTARDPDGHTIQLVEQ